jgi:exoribonuclease R
MALDVKQQLDLKKLDLKKFNWVSNKGSTELDLDIAISIDDAIDNVLNLGI